MMEDYEDKRSYAIYLPKEFIIILLHITENINFVNITKI